MIFMFHKITKLAMLMLFLLNVVECSATDAVCEEGNNNHSNDPIINVPYVPEISGSSRHRDLCRFINEQWVCHNWAGTIYWHPHSVFIPNNEDELSGFLSSNEHQFKIIGHAHSWSSLFVPPPNGVNVIINRLSGIVEIGPDYVDTMAGGSFTDLHRELDDAGMALAWFSGGIQGLSIGGAVSVGFHGSQLSLGSISTVISYIELFDTDGVRHILDIKKNQSAMSAARLGVGVCGVITRVRLPIRPQFYLRRSRWRRDNISSFFTETWWSNHDLFHYYIHPYTQTAWPMIWEYISKEESLRDNRPCRLALEQIEDSNEKEFGVDGLPLIMRWDNCSDVSYKAYTHAIDMDAQFIWNGEYFLPLMTPHDEYLIVRHFLEFIFKDASIDWWIHMRYMKGDNQTLVSPCYGWRACVGIELALVASTMGGGLPQKDEWLKHFLPFEQYMLAKGGRPHHAKYHTQKQYNNTDITPEFIEICGMFDRRKLLKTTITYY